MNKSDIPALYMGRALPQAKERLCAGDSAARHWHIDVLYLNICGPFYRLCSTLHGYSRHIVPGEICGSMTEAEIETILQRERKACPGVTPKIISDNGPQFAAKHTPASSRLRG
jgi:putative transposase